MANKDGHRRFGNVRKRESGRYQVRYPGPDGRIRTAPKTFATKGEADRYLTLIEAQILNGEWTDPDKAKIKLGDYAAKWIDQRPGLRPRTVELYLRLLRKNIAPHLGAVQLGKLSTPMIRDWRTALLKGGVSASVTAKAYRLLRAVLTTATEDRLIPRNPCRIRGAGDENPDERPVLTVAQVFELADLVGRHPVGNIRELATGEFQLRYSLDGGDERRTFPQTFPDRRAAERALWNLANEGRAQTTRDDRYRALVLLAAFTSLRWGEIVALRRCDVDTDECTVAVRRQYLELDTGELVLGPPKSRAGSRTVSFPRSILPTILDHLARFVGPGPDALVFTAPNKAVFRRGNFRRGSRWKLAVETVGVPGLHFHDLRHTGNVLAAKSGASLRDLMARMGQDSVRAALIYQHASSAAGRAIAAAIDDQISTVNGDGHEDDDGDGGAAGTLAPVG